MLLVVGSVPAGLVGFFLETPLKALFTDARLAAVFLIVNAAVLLTAEWFRRRDERRRRLQQGAAARHARDDPDYAPVERLTLRAALIVGACQVAALLPGISRSGVTMAAGLVAGLRHEEAARFSFLLATPIILAAGLLEVPNLGADRPTALLAGVAAAIAGVVAYLSARFLLRYLRTGRLDPFAYYCAALGIVALILVR
jgi:undecaprenyl-diphosphatase